MKQVVFIITFLVSINQVFCHSPNEVSFSMYSEGDFLLVDAEFPWTLRNAVFMFDSSLNKQSSVQEIQRSLFTYINHNLLLTDEDGVKMNLLKVTDKKGQSHHEEYQLTFENKPIHSIKNTLLFNFGNKQKNFHTLNLNGLKKEFVLTKNNPSIIFERKKSHEYLVYFFGGLILLLGFFIIKKTKSS